MILKLYSKLVSDFHKFTLLLILIVVTISLYFSKNFNLDASSDALLLEGDKDLKYLREINNRYGSKDFLFFNPRVFISFKIFFHSHNYAPISRNAVSTNSVSN